MRNARFMFAALALVMLAAGCGKGAALSGVNVKTVATDLTYGIPKPVAPASPANTNPIPSNPLPVIKQGGGTIPEQFPAQGPPPDPCPTAPPTVFPPEATTEIQGRPLEGEYMWRVQGSQKIQTIGSVRLPPFTKRNVLDVKSSSAGFTFTVEEKELVFGSAYTVKTTYEVRTAGGVSGQDSPGVYLIKIERIHRTDENANSTFTPNPAILLLPTPAQIGTDIDSVGIDPSTLEVLRHTGKVMKRVRVDACGKPVDTFYVQATQQFASANGDTTRREFDYGIATANGGLPMVEHVESPCVDANGVCDKNAVTFKMDAHIGQLTPTRGKA